MSRAVPMPVHTELPAGHPFRKLWPIGLGVGTVSLVGGFGYGAATEMADFYFAYTVAFMYFLSLSLGSLFFVLIHHATSAGWSVVVRRIAENVMGILPFFALLSIPMFLGYHDLYHHWLSEEAATDPILMGKAAYLNLPFFFTRAVIYFGLWTLMAVFFRRTSMAQDISGDPALTTKMRMRSYPSILVFALTLSFAAIDWMKSMDPHWYSTMWGVYYFAGSVVAMFSLLAFISLALRRTGVLHDAISIEHYHDLGKYMFAFTVFWTYIVFSQYMLIWYANMPEETIWFEHRMRGSWYTVCLVLSFGHFVIPFFFTLPRTIKRTPNALMVATVWILTLHYVDLYFIIAPIRHPEGVAFGLIDVLCILAVGGFFVAIFGRLMSQGAILPVKDPFLQESLAFENF